MTSSRESRRGRRPSDTGKRTPSRRAPPPAARPFIPDWLKISAVVVAAFVAAIIAIFQISSSHVETTTTIINDNVNAHLKKTELAVGELKDAVGEMKEDIEEVKNDVGQIKVKIVEMEKDIDDLAKIHPAHHASSRQLLHVSHDDGAN